MKGNFMKAIIEAIVSIFKKKPKPAQINYFTATTNPDTTTTLAWSVSNASVITLNGSNVQANFTHTVAPLVNTTYTLSATGQTGAVYKSVTAQAALPVPTINACVSFQPNTSSILSWTISNSASQTLDQVSIPAIGNKTYADSTTLTHTIIATNARGSANQTVTVPAMIGLPVISANVVTLPNTTSILSWSIAGSTAVTLDNVNVASVGNKTYSDTIAQNHIIVASNAVGSANKTVSVPAATPMPTLNVSNVVQANTTSVVSWNTTNVTTLTLDGAVAANNGNCTFADTIDKSHTFIASNVRGNITQTIVVPAAIALPIINAISTVQSDTSTILSWTITGAISQTLDNVTIPPIGNHTYTDSTALNHTLVASNARGSVTQTINVPAYTHVTPPPVTTDVANVSISATGAVTISRNGAIYMNQQNMWGASVGNITLAQTKVDVAGKVITFSNGNVTMTVAHSIDPTHANRILWDVSIVNSSGRDLQNFNLNHNLMYFPGNATNTLLRGCGATTGVNYAEYIWQDGTACIVNETAAIPIGFSTAGVNAGLPNAIFWAMNGAPMIPNGCTIKAKTSLRFGESSQTGAYAEAVQSYSTTHPYMVNWPDRRPIVPSFERWDGPTSTAAYPPLPSITYLVSNIKAMNGQGFILWDLLGNICGDYGGDLNWLSTTNPTAAAQVDEWMSTARAAGVTPGLALRWGIPQMHTETNGSFSPWYSDTTTGSSVDECATFLIGQAKFARDRWGCRIFYVDCADPRYGDVWSVIQAAVPDCLFLPENVCLSMYRATAPYRESRQASANNFENFAIDLPAARQVWPQAFGVLKVDDETPERLAQFRPQIVQMVKSGVVLLGRNATWISAVYADAAK